MLLIPASQVPHSGECDLGWGAVITKQGRVATGRFMQWLSFSLFTFCTCQVHLHIPAQRTRSELCVGFELLVFNLKKKLPVYKEETLCVSSISKYVWCVGIICYSIDFEQFTTNLNCSCVLTTKFIKSYLHCCHVFFFQWFVLVSTMVFFLFDLELLLAKY